MPTETKNAEQAAPALVPPKIDEEMIGLGRRKTSVARVRLRQGSGKIRVNGKDLQKYFPVDTYHQTVLYPLKLTQTEGHYDIVATVNGGGFTGQAGALQLGISRILIKLGREFELRLREERLLTRDPRQVERKKYGHKKARKSFQFSKR